MFGAAYTCNSIDRQVVSVVIEPIKHQFALSDRAVGLLGGAVYTTAFAIACLPIGWLIDRYSRRNLLCILLTVWGGLTLLTGMARSFPALVLARMGVGAAEAGGQPVCLSLLADYFAPAERSTAIGYFYLSTALGIVISFLAGGWVAGHWGWQAAFYLAGIPGILVASVIGLTVAEPRRGRFEGKAAPAHGFREVLVFIWRCRPLLHLCIGMTLTAMTISTQWLWAASLLIRNHGLAIGTAGPIVALGAGFSALGSAVAGRVADRIGQTSLARRMLVPVVTTALCVPFGIGFALAPSTAVSVVCLVATGFLMGGFLGPCFSAMTILAPPEMRGTMAALLQVSINLVGTGAGPVIVGALSDNFGTKNSLGDALAVVALANAWAAAHFWRVRSVLAPLPVAVKEGLLF